VFSHSLDPEPTLVSGANGVAALPKSGVETAWVALRRITVTLKRR
jgi:hypothetical protein